MSAAKVEIKVDKIALTTDINNMIKLRNTTENFMSSISFEKSKGQSIDSFNLIYEQILGLQNDLADLYNNTAVALNKTKFSFNEADNSAGNFFAGKGDN